MKYLNQANIQRLQVIPLLVQQIQELVQSRGFADIQAPLRNFVKPEGKLATYGTMMAVSEALDLFVCKAINFIEENPKQGRASVNAMVNVFSYASGLPLAVLDGIAMTNLKCVAITGYFTHVCAPDESDTLALIGSSVMAEQQFLGVAAVRPIKQVQVYSRSPIKVKRLIANLAEAFPKLHFIACDSVEEAQKGAQILCTATSSGIPLINHLDPACRHINCVGSYTHSSREISREIFDQANLLVEDRITAVQEAGLEHSQALDLRSDPDMFNDTLKPKLTLFSSTGHSSLDLVASWHILQQAKDV